MSASSPNPSSVLLLAGLGIGAYWLLTRRAAASQVPTSAQIPNTGVANPYVGPLASISTAIGSFLGTVKSAANGTYDGRSATPWDTQSGVAPANNPSAFSSAVDGAAYNPPAGAPFDTAWINNAWGQPSVEMDYGWTNFQ